MLTLSQQLSTANSLSVRGGVSKVPSPSLITFWMASSYAVLMQITTATTRLFSPGECWQCHTQETAFQKMPLHPLAQRFLPIPLPCYLSLNGQRYLIKMPHLGRHSQSLRPGASLILRASRDVPFTRFISYHQVKFLKKKFNFLPHSPCCLAQEQWFPKDGPWIISIHTTWNMSRNKNTEILHAGTSRLCFNKPLRIPIQSHFIIDHTVPQMRISEKLQVFCFIFLSHSI